MRDCLLELLRFPCCSPFRSIVHLEDGGNVGRDIRVHLYVTFARVDSY